MIFRNWALAGVRALALTVLCTAASITLFVLTVVSVVLIPVLGIGLITTPWVLEGVRMQANLRRLLAAQWSDVRIPATYRPWPPDLQGGLIGQAQRTRHLLTDPATWRDVRWLFTDMIAGSVLAIVTVALTFYPLEGYVIAAGVWDPMTGGGDHTYWYGFVPVSSQSTAFMAAGLGTALLAVGLFTSHRLLAMHFQMTKGVLAPREVELAQRVARLTETRSDAVDNSAAELRRIERDLHDGAQARLVAMGMSLGTIEALIEKDPAKAKELVSRARGESAEALTELRDLVRGIHPPVLAERGLADAVRALALRMPVPVEVDIDLGTPPGRAAEPVESAAYFAVSEVLTNAIKHAEAQRVWLDMGHRDGMLRIAITDDGRGGASVDKGSGLAGVERRLGTFDGVLAVNSPVGGPTMVTLEIPCELSSPKTSSF